MTAPDSTPTAPVPVMDPELTGSTRPEIFALAMSGQLAAAAGGQNHLTQETAEPLVTAVMVPLLEQVSTPAQDTPAVDTTTTVDTSSQTDTSSSSGSKTSTTTS